MTLNQLIVKAQCILLTDASYRVLRKPKKIKVSKDPYASHQGSQVPSYNLNISKDKSPLKVSYPYATCSKGESPTLSLSTTASMGSRGLRKTQTQSVTFCSKCLGKPFWI